MSVNLILRVEGTDTEATNKANWEAMKAAAGHEWAMVTIDDDTIKSIGRLLDGVTLTNGETVTAYACDEDDQYAAMICGFGPSLLPTQVQDQVRDRLATTENGKAAVRLFNEVIRLGLQVAFNGTEHCPGHIKGVNWVADEVEFNRSSGNMNAMLRELGLGDAVDADPDSDFGEVEFDRFVQAVNDNGLYTDCGQKLQRLVACGQRRGATHIYWG